jgi:hypothetical protein
VGHRGLTKQGFGGGAHRGGVVTANDRISTVTSVFIDGEGLAVVDGDSGGLLQLRGREGGEAWTNFNRKACRVVLTEDGDDDDTLTQIR